MLYDNAIADFYTDGGNGTSMYFVRANGTTGRKLLTIR